MIDVKVFVSLQFLSLFKIDLNREVDILLLPLFMWLRAVVPLYTSSSAVFQSGNSAYHRQYHHGTWVHCSTAYCLLKFVICFMQNRQIKYTVQPLSSANLNVYLNVTMLFHLCII